MNKKIFVRIGAVIATVLLVGCLVLPCFADQPVPYGEALSAFYDLLDQRAYNLALISVTDYYYGFGDMRFFQNKTVVSGTLDLNFAYRDFTFLNTLWSSDDGTFRTSMPIDYMRAYGFQSYDSFVTDIYDQTISDENLVLELTMSKGDTYEEGTLICQFYVPNGGYPLLTVTYDLTFSSVSITGTIDKIYFSSTAYEPDSFYRVDIAFVPSDTNNYYSLPFFVNSVFASTVSTSVYKNFVYSPSDFLSGFSASYNLGYNDGKYHGEQLGYTNGFAAGESQEHIQDLTDQAYADGVAAGLADNDAYNKGYDKARSEITSGEFGENLIGGMFNNINAAVTGFRLFEYNGTWITLGTVFAAGIGISLFVWLLKCIAGG